MSRRGRRNEIKSRGEEPTRCSCMHAADTPEWHGAKRSGVGLTGRGAAHHGNPFTHAPGCVHSELQRTTRPRPKKRTIKRIRLQ